MDKHTYYHKKLEALNQPERIFERPLLPIDPKKFHIVGICGTAMGSLAGLLRDKEYEVSGSDQACYPPISNMLDQLDVDVHTGNYEAKNIGDADIVVIGNVATPKNPEAVYAREEQLPQTTLPEVLREYVFGDAKRIVVAGTHGKTTTTGIAASVFGAAGKEPGFMIGGVPQGQEKSFALGKGEFAIFEGDEYDTSYFNKMPKFLQYGAHTGIITAVELDHLDIYSDFDDYRRAFEFFAAAIPKDGFLFVNGDADVTRVLSEICPGTAYTYGLQETNDAYAKNIQQHSNGTQTFDFVFQGKDYGEVTTPLPGTYNVANCVAVIGVALVHGLDFDLIKKGIASFGGMKRRQEVVGEIDGITVIDDFAHHPTSVRETLQGLKNKYSGRRLITLFEPRSNSSRKKVFEKEYLVSFDAADHVYIKMPKFRHNDNPEDFIDINVLTQGITERGTPAHEYDDVDALVDDVVPILKTGDVVVMMSNGNFDGLQEKLLARLEEKE